MVQLRLRKFLELPSSGSGKHVGGLFLEVIGVGADAATELEAFFIAGVIAPMFARSSGHIHHGVHGFLGRSLVIFLGNSAVLDIRRHVRILETIIGGVCNFEDVVSNNFIFIEMTDSGGGNKE